MDTIKERVNEDKKLEEFKLGIDNLIEELNLIEDDNEFQEKLAKMNKHEIDILAQEISKRNLYKSIGTKDVDDKSVVCFSFINLREEYYKKLLTTSLIGYTYRMSEEYQVDELDLDVPLREEDFKEVLECPDKNDKEFVKFKFSEYFMNAKQQDLTQMILSDDECKSELEYLYSVNYIYKNADNVDIDFVKQEYDTLMDNLNLQGDLNDQIDLVYSVNLELAKRTKWAREQLDLYFESKKTYSINKIKYETELEKNIRMQSNKEKKIIQRFLDTYFEFNPDLHVQKVMDPQNDPERKMFSPSMKPIKNMTETELVHTKVPPNDMFCRFKTYYELNYDTLRQATNDIYNVKPDLEYAIHVYDKFDSVEEGNKFIDKYRNQATMEIFNIQTKQWTLLGPFKENRDRIDFYNKNTKIIEGMIEQNESDAKLGSELIKDRVRKKKVKNTKIYGPDNKLFEIYKKSTPSEINSLYGVTVEDLPDGTIKVTSEKEVGEDGTEVDKDGTPLNALEIDIHHINAKTSESKMSRIYTKAKED